MDKFRWFHLLFIVIMLNSRAMLCSRNLEKQDKRKDKGKREKEIEDRDSDEDNRGSTSRTFGCHTFFAKMSWKREKPGTELDTVEVEELLISKIRKYWRKNEKKLAASKKLCSNDKLLYHTGHADAYEFFLNKFIRIVYNEDVDYEKQRVQFSYQNEGGKDLLLLACRCEITKEETDSDNIEEFQLAYYDEKNAEADDEKDEFDLRYEIPRPSTDSVDIFFGYNVAPGSNHSSPTATSEKGLRIPSLDAEIPTRKKDSAFKFSRATMSLSSKRLEDMEQPLGSPDTNSPVISENGSRRPSSSGVKIKKDLDLEFSQAPKSLSSRRFEGTEETPNSPEIVTAPSSFKLPFRRQSSVKSLDYGEPSSSPVRVTPFQNQQFGKFSDYGEASTSLTGLPRMLSSRSKFSDSDESHIRDEISSMPRSKTIDLSKVGISPKFSRWVINNAEEVPASNICVDGKVYVSKGVSGKNSFFLYAKNLEDHTFNVIGYFKL